MSDLRPRGVSLELGGEKRELLFTLNVMDDIQNRTGEPVFSTLQKLFEKEEMNGAVKLLLSSLLTDEAERKKWMDPKSTLKPVSEKEAGWLVDVGNIGEAVTAILTAYRISMPEAEEDEEPDPNVKSGRS